MANNTMDITVFAKRRQNAQGITFYNYLATLTNKRTGEPITATVRFPVDNFPAIPDCPINISVNKDTANLAPRKYHDTNGNERTAYTLWVKDWKERADKYVDRSLEDF